MTSRRCEMSGLKIVTACAGALFSVTAAGRTQADEGDVLQEIARSNKKAIAAYQALDFRGARSQLLLALMLAEDNGLSAHPMAARTFLNLGVVNLEGLKDAKKAAACFASAVRIAPGIELSPSLVTNKALLALDQARGRSEGDPVPSSKSGGSDKRARHDLEVRLKKAEASEKEAAEREQHLAGLLVQVEEREGKERAANHDAVRALETKLVQAQRREKKLEAEHERLQAELASTRRSLDDAEGRLAEAVAREEKLLASKDRLQRETQLAGDRERERKALEARALETKLAQAEQKGKKLEAEYERLQADFRSVKKTLDGAEAMLAEAAAREEKLLASKDKLQRETRLASDRERERKALEEGERLARQKLVEGPALPAELSQRLHCLSLDEGQVKVDLFVHCAVEASLKPAVVALYYRPWGALHFDSVAMERSKKGWYVATVPGSKLANKKLQYYVEARDGHDRVLVAAGKATSPNLAVLSGASAARTAADGSDRQAAVEAVASRGSSASGPKKAASSAKAGGKKPHDDPLVGLQL